VENLQLGTLGLSVTDIPSEELFDTWQDLLALRMRADAYITAMRARFDKATDLVERERLWARLEVLWPSYQVLSAWTDVVHAAYVFATEGHESLFMDDRFTTSSEFFPF
jgi:hypothetical protein